MRRTDLDAILFPVAVRRVFFQNADGRPVPIEGRKVIVNDKTQHALGVVNAGYRLVTNQEALTFAQKCASQLFGNVKAGDLEVFNAIAPERGWCCHVDLIHKGYEVNFLKNEVYLPFVRMTNSYNGTRALRFDVGYCRKLCRNGVIFEKETIEFKFSHSEQAIGKTLEFQVEKGRLEGLRQRFEKDAERLHGFTIPEATELPLFFKALSLPMPLSETNGDDERRWDIFRHLADEASKMTDGYFKSLGRNAYALFNALTDFASNCPEIKGFHRDPHTMQARAGSWAGEFSHVLSENSAPDLAKYLEEYGTFDFGKN